MARFHVFMYLSIYVKNKEQKSSAKKITQNSKSTTDTGLFYSCNHQKWLHYQIVGGKILQNVQIDPQTTDTWSKKLIVTP